MPLDPQTQEISLAAALDTADDPQGSPQGLLVATNVVWTKDRVQSKRGGFRRVSNTTNAFSDNLALVSAGTTLGMVRQDRVVPYIGASITNTPANTSSLIDHSTVGTYFGGTVICATDQVRLEEFGRDWLCLTSTQTTELSGTDVYTSAVMEVHVQVVDLVHGAVVFDAALESGSFAAHPVTIVNASVTHFGILYLRKSAGPTYDVRFVRVNMPGVTLSTPVTVASGIGVTEFTMEFDVIPDASNSSQCVIAYRNSGGDVAIAIVDGAGAVVDSNTPTIECHSVCSLLQLSDGRYNLWVDDGDNYSCTLYDSGLTLINTTAIVDDLDGDDPDHSRCLAQIECVQRGNPIPYQICLLKQSILHERIDVYMFDATPAGGFSSLATGTSLNSVLLSKPWVYHSEDDDGVYVTSTPLNAIDTGYHTTLVLRVPTTAIGDTQTVGQLTFDEQGANPDIVPASMMLSNPIVYSADTYLVASLVDLETGDGNHPETTVKRVRISRLQFGVDRSIVTVSLGQTGFVSGSAPLAFDGTVSRIASFLDGPDEPTITDNTMSGVLTGTYNYRIIYEFTDVRGNIQVSPPSAVVTSVVTAKQISFTGTLRTHVLHDDLAGQRNFRVKLYRTKDLATTFQLVLTASVAVGGTWALTDNLPDNVLQEDLYTTGNVLESEPLPPLRYLAVHRNRLFGIRSDTPEVIPYTQEIFDPFFPRWHSALTFRVDTADGEPTALASLSDKLIVFQPNAIAATAGQGPDSTGGNSSFALPETIARGVGVAYADRGSVATVPAGIVFRHSTGIQLITPDLQVAPIGRAVEGFLEGYDVIRARFLPSLHQAWFLLRPQSETDDPQRIAVYDVRYNRWSIFTTSAAQFVDVIEHLGVVYLLNADRLYTYDLTFRVDDAAETTPAYAMAFETPWFRVDRAQALRLWKLHLSGSVVSLANTTITASVYTQQSQTVDKDASLPDLTYVWGPSMFAATPAGPLTLSARMVTQRCQAFRCRFDFDALAANTGEVFRPATVTYDFGVLPSRGKVPAGRRPTNTTP